MIARTIRSVGGFAFCLWAVGGAAEPHVSVVGAFVMGALFMTVVIDYACLRTGKSIR